MTDPAASPPPKRRRAWRWVRRVVLFLGLVVLLAVAGVVLLVRNLDQPWVKRHVQSQVRAAAGLDLDYRATHLSSSGLVIEDLVVLTPEVLRKTANEFVRVGRLEARWTLASLRDASGSRLTGVSVQDVAVTLVSDEKLGATLDALGSSEPDSKPPTPLSGQAAALLSSPFPVARVDLARVGVTLVQSSGGKVGERLSLQGLGLSLDAARIPAGGWGLTLTAGTAQAPVALSVTRAGHGAASLKLALAASVDSRHLEAALDLGVSEQSLVPGLGVQKLLGLGASAGFDAAAGQTQVSLGRLEAADGALSASGSLVLPDQGAAPLLKELRGEVDIGRALRLVPPGLLELPVVLESGRAGFQVAGLRLEAMPRLEATGSAQVDAEARAVVLSLPDLTLRVPTLRASLSAKPKKGAGIEAVARVSGEGLRAVLGTKRIDASELVASLTGTQRTDGAWDGSGEVRVRGLAAEIGASIRGEAQLGLSARALRLDLASPLETKGTLQLDARLPSLVVALAPWRVKTTDLSLTAKSQLTGAPPFAVDLDLPSGRLEVTGVGEQQVLDSPLKLHASLTGAHPDLARPLRSRGAVKADLELGAIRAGLVATKEPDAVEYTLTALASALKVVGPFLPKGWGMPLEQMTASLRSLGRVERLGAGVPTLNQRAALTVERPGLTLAAGAGSAERLDLTLRTEGTASRQSLDGELSLRALVLGKSPQGDGRLTLSGAFDLDAPSARVKLSAARDSGPSVSADLKASFDRPQRRVTYDLSASASRLATLAPLLAPRGKLAGLDLKTLSATVSAAGAFAGVVQELAVREGRVVLAPRPLATLAGESRLTADVESFSWAAGEQEVAVAKGRFQAQLTSAGGVHTLRSDFSAPAVHLAFGVHEVDLTGFSDSLEATSGDPLAGVGEVRQKALVRGAKLSTVPGYPLADLTLALHAVRDAEGTVRAPLIQVDNPAAGTSLKLEGSAALGPDRRTLSLRGSLEQDLARAWTDREAFQGAGRLDLALRLDSPDLHSFHAEGEARFSGARLQLARAGWAAESVDAEVPLEADFALGASGWALRPQPGNDAFSQMRFADQHPFRSRPSFLSIGRLVTPAVTLAPVAGNLEVAKGVVLLSQLEVGVRNGVVTGQCALRFQGKDPTLLARVRASGVESSRGEPFDGNLAVSVSTRDRRVDGRAEVLRIGRRHLLDLLDVQDPFHADASLNRIRTGLALGYPDHVRLTFRQGFASLGVTFGGAASLLKLDEVRGIPVGPLLDKALSGMSKKEEP